VFTVNRLMTMSSNKSCFSHCSLIAWEALLTREKPIYRADIWVSPIYRNRPKRPILSASVGVDKALLYSSRIQTTCARKHNEASKDSYLTATLGAYSQTSRRDESWSTRRPSQPKKASSLIQLINNHSKIMKLPQFEKIQLINPDVWSFWKRGTA